jgi:hypothetical protein
MQNISSLSNCGWTDGWTDGWMDGWMDGCSLYSGFSIYHLAILDLMTILDK